MKIVKMTNLEDMLVGVTPAGRAELFNRFYSRLMSIANSYKHLASQPYSKTIEEHMKAFDYSGKYNDYLYHNARNSLEYILYKELMAYDDMVQYAYEYIEDIQPHNIREIEDKMAEGSTKSRYYNNRRKRYIDMKRVLETNTVYTKAYNKAIKTIRYKLK